MLRRPSSWAGLVMGVVASCVQLRRGIGRKLARLSVGALNGCVFPVAAAAGEPNCEGQVLMVKPRFCNKLAVVMLVTTSLLTM